VNKIEFIYLTVLGWEEIVLHFCYFVSYIEQHVAKRNCWISINNAANLIIQILVDRANAEVGILMPGYTHLQRAQPVQWSHWLLRYSKDTSQDAATPYISTTPDCV